MELTREQQLHDRSTRGNILSEAERAELETWYAQQDAEEYKLLGSVNAASLVDIRKQVDEALSQAEVTAARANAMCLHKYILVDYLHPHQTLIGIRVSDLQTSDTSQMRPKMTLDKPRCADCGKPMGRSKLKKRTRLGGDLYDSHFVWCSLTTWWKFW